MGRMAAARGGSCRSSPGSVRRVARGGLDGLGALRGRRGFGPGTQYQTIPESQIDRRERAVEQASGEGDGDGEVGCGLAHAHPAHGGDEGLRAIGLDRVADATAAEGGDLVFPVTLSRASASAVNVDWTTADATATAGDDYTADGGTLVVPAGQTTGTIRVHTLSDTSNETTETLTVNLSNPVNKTIADAQGLGTITNDDTLPTLSVSGGTLTEGDTGSSNLSFQVTLSAPSEIGRAHV